MSKKGDISMSTIVMAAVALIVLIILAAVVINFFANNNENLSSCEVQGGVCAFSCPPSDPKYGGYINENRLAGVTCAQNGVDLGQICCVP